MGVERDPVKAAVSHRELVGRGSRQSFEVSCGSYWRQGGCTHSKVRARDFVIPKLPARQKVAAFWGYHCFGRKNRILGVEEFKKESQRMALFHFKQTRAADMMSDSGTLRVKPDEKLMRTGESSQTSCCSTWPPPGDQERTRGGRDVHLADVDLGLVLLQTVGEEMAKIQQERTQWMHRM